MRLFELLRDGESMGEAVEFSNGEFAVRHFMGAVDVWDALAAFEAGDAGRHELVPRHAPHAFLSDRGNRGVLRAWVQEPA